MKKKYFSIKAIWIATFLGGPLVGGFLIASNFYRFNKRDYAFWSIIFSILFTIVFFWLLFRIPDAILDKIPNTLFPIIHAPIFGFLAYRFQKTDIQLLEAEQVPKEHWSKTLGFGVIGLAFTISILFAMASYEPIFPGEKYAYGGMHHELYYEGDNFSEQLLEKIGNNLESWGYFSNEFMGVAHVKEWKTMFIISLYIDKSYWNDQQLIEDINFLKQYLNTDLGKEVTIRLIHDNFTDTEEKVL